MTDTKPAAAKSAAAKSAEITCIICPNGCHITVKERPDGKCAAGARFT